MGVKLTVPGLSGVITVPDSLVARYEAQGWVVPVVRVEKPVKYVSQQNRKELLATAVERGIEVDEEATRKQLLEVIEGASK